MKKIIASLVLVCLVAVCFAGCAKTDAAKNVIAMIKTIGTDTDGAYLDEIASAYDALNAKEKKQVGNYNKYEKAKSEYDEITAFNDDIAAVVDASTTSFSQSTVNFTELIERGYELLDEYEDMKKSRQESVVGIDKVPAAIEVLEEYEDNAVNCAGAYCKAFLEINKDKNYEITDLGCIMQIREGKQYLFFALTYLDGEKEENVYSTARFGDPSVYTVLCERPDIFYVDEPVDETSDALANRNIELSLEEVLAVEVE